MISPPCSFSKRAPLPSSPTGNSSTCSVLAVLSLLVGLSSNQRLKSTWLFTSGSPITVLLLGLPFLACVMLCCFVRYVVCLPMVSRELPPRLSSLDWNTNEVNRRNGIVNKRISWLHDLFPGLQDRESSSPSAYPWSVLPRVLPSPPFHACICCAGVPSNERGMSGT